jgi:hypothetical protein
LTTEASREIESVNKKLAENLYNIWAFLMFIGFGFVTPFSMFDLQIGIFFGLHFIVVLFQWITSHKNHARARFINLFMALLVIPILTIRNSTFTSGIAFSLPWFIAAVLAHFCVLASQRNSPRA